MPTVLKKLIWFFILLFAVSVAAQQMEVAWGVQIGSSGEDFMRDVISDSEGNCYVVGTTNGNLEGDPAGMDDGYIAKYDGDGHVLWQDQFGTAGSEKTTGVALDNALNAYVFGQTGSTLGDVHVGATDMFVRKYDKEGSVLWTKQIGTTKNDYSSHIKIDGNNQVFLVGRTTGDWDGENQGSNDAVAVKLDTEGNVQWVSQFGSSGSDEGHSISCNTTGEVFVVGQTTGDLGGENQGDLDGYLAKMSSDGEVQWIRQFGTTSRDHARCIALDDKGFIYIGGWTGGLIGEHNYGGGDAYLGYFDSEGQNIWYRQFGTYNNWDGAHGMTLVPDGSNDVLVGGCWNGPSCHGWLRRYNQSGDLIWDKEIYNSTSKSTCGQKVDIDSNGNCYQAGGTEDSLFGTAEGNNDGFLVKLSFSSNVVEPDQKLKTPKSFYLNQNYPNPFNPLTKIQFSIKRASQVCLIITNTSGQPIKTLVNEFKSVGTYSAVWDATDETGKPVSSGLYICQFVAEGMVENTKMVLIR